jgi:3-hydroxyisobutyrate dehydrogenase
MGTAVLTRLADASGTRLLAGDTNPEREAAVTALGAAWVPDTRELASAADVVLTILPGSRELQEATSIFLEALAPGAGWIDMTSAAPPVGVALMNQASRRRIASLEAPIGGGPQAMIQGTAQLFVGGETEVVERHRGLLDRLGRIEQIGGTGAGYTAKLLVNLMWFTHAISTAEALLLARSQGLDLAALAPVLTRSSARSGFVEHDLAGLLEGDYLTSFGLERCHEELQATAELAHEAGLPFELSRLVRDIYERAVKRYGNADGELLPVAMLEEQAGLKLRRRAAE